MKRGHNKSIMIIKIRMIKLVGKKRKYLGKAGKKKKGKMYISFWIHRIGVFLIFLFLRL